MENSEKKIIELKDEGLQKRELLEIYLRALDQIFNLRTKVVASLLICNQSL